LQLHALTPEFFQLIQATALFLHDVDNHIAEVDDDPVGGGSPSTPSGSSLRRGFLNHVVGDGHHMTRGCAGADNHAIGDAGFALNVEGDDVLTFQVINFVDNKILECFTLQVFPWVKRL
jgi:hypothetical protein